MLETLQTPVNNVTRQNAFHVIDDATVLHEGFHIHVKELLMCHRENDRIKLRVWNLVGHRNTIFLKHMFGIGPRIIDRDIRSILTQRMVDVNHLCIADVRAVLLEGDAKNKDFGILHHHALLVHALDSLVGHIGTHAIIQSSGSMHDAWQHTINLCFLDEIYNQQINLPYLQHYLYQNFQLIFFLMNYNY